MSSDRKLETDKATLPPICLGRRSMATTHPTVHVSALRNRSATFPSQRRTRPCRVRCASFPQNQSRRSISTALLLFHWCCSNPKHAYASGIFDKYVKRKKLDPLEAYVPAVLLTQSQFKDLEKTLEDGKPEYAFTRSLLRSGPAASLRINIRAVAQYASDDGRGKAAFDAVDRCLGALEDLDSLLLHASRNDPTATVESMKTKINTALGALDRRLAIKPEHYTLFVSSRGTCACPVRMRKVNLVGNHLDGHGLKVTELDASRPKVAFSLLQTVPSTVLDKGKAIADAYNTPSGSEDGKPEDLDPDLKQLEELL